MSAAPNVDLAAFDILFLNTSAGKDSQAMLSLLFKRAAFAGVRDRLVAVHADLGESEWPGTKDLANQQATHFGVPFYVVRRTQDTLLEYVERRQKWPSSTTRYCTSEFKRSPCSRVMTQLVQAWREAHNNRRCRVLNCFGFRAQESPARAKRKPLAFNKRASTKTTREVWDYLPIHTWDVEQVWAEIRKAGAPYHWAYDRGMTRLSCRFCIFAPRNQLLVAACQPENKQLLNKYVRLENKIGHTFRKDQSLKEIQDAVDAGERPKLDGDDGAWNM